MDSARSYREERLDEAALATARERAKHVIVLMLENRSFDHLLGLLDHPKSGTEFENVEVGTRPNPYDLTQPEPAATVADSGNPRLEHDPPHGHVSAMTQLNLQGTDFGMNGFVAAYAQKIAGTEHHPQPRWGRIALLVAVLLVPLAAALHELARRSVSDGWRGFGWWFVGAATGVAAVVFAVRLPALPGLRRRYLLTGAAIGAFVLALAAAGIENWIDEPRGVVSWTIATALILAAVLRFVRGKLIEAVHVPEGRMREMSRRIMWCMRPERIPALAHLARTYAVCTRWHSSVPGATWPNRNFAHAATSDESVDIELGFYSDPTIFEALEDAGGTWRIYHHDTPQAFAFDALWKGGREGNWFDAAQLLTDIAAGDLPTYSFVEPCHRGSRANSQHPGNNEKLASDDFERGDMLVASIYNALVAKPELFRETVFVVTYDEHGGFFDHVAPPKAVHPEPRGDQQRSRELTRRLVSKFVEYGNRPFPFTTLGVRVPTVVVSPWVNDSEVDPTVYDHASIVASIRRLWAPDVEPLSRRDEFANDFLHLLVGRNVEMPAPVRVADYDDQAAGLESVVGTEAVDMEVDAAARGQEEESVLLRDDFTDQLAKLNHLVRREIRASASAAAGPASAPGAPAPAPGRGDVGVVAGEEAVAAGPVPTAALFKAYADSTRNGNPDIADI